MRDIQAASGERGEAPSFPPHAETEALSGPRSHSAESSTPGESTEAPAPTGGLMFVRCGTCNAALPSVPVALGDPADGLISHGCCPPCERLALAEVEAMQIPAVAYDGAVGEQDVEPDDDREDCGGCCDCGTCDLCAGDDVEVDGYHNDRDAGAKAFLTGLGLEALPGGIAVVLFIPWALLALAVGR